MKKIIGILLMLTIIINLTGCFNEIEAEKEFTSAKNYLKNNNYSCDENNYENESICSKIEGEYKKQIVLRKQDDKFTMAYTVVDETGAKFTISLANFCYNGFVPVVDKDNNSLVIIHGSNGNHLLPYSIKNSYENECINNSNNNGDRCKYLKKYSDIAYDTAVEYQEMFKKLDIEIPKCGCKKYSKAGGCSQLYR